MGGSMKITRNQISRIIREMVEDAENFNFGDAAPHPMLRDNYMGNGYVTAMFEPIMFPRIRPLELLLIAAIEVKSSGAEVAIDTTVSPITTLGIPKYVARSEQWSHSKSPPLIRK